MSGIDPATLVAWHDAECGAYRCDLPLWYRLAGPEASQILELGSGTGRVATALARRGHLVTAVDSDPILLEALGRREPSIRRVEADVRCLWMGSSYDLVLAPMQMLQLLVETEDRGSALAAVRRHLRPGGRFAAAVLDFDSDEIESGVDLIGEVPQQPDVTPLDDGREARSTPVALVVDSDGVMTVTRRREVIATATGRSGVELEETVSHRLRLLTVPQVEAELNEVGMSVVSWHSIPATDLHMGALVVLAEIP